MTRRLYVTHLVRFHYQHAIRETVMELRLRLHEGPDQRLIDFELKVNPDGRLSSHVDGFGNVVHHLERPDPHTMVEAVSDRWPQGGRDQDWGAGPG